MNVMTIHVLHAGDGYLYLMRSVAVQDGRLAPGESLAGYYTAKGQPPGRWAGRAARDLGVRNAVTEEQMRALFGRGQHPDTDRLTAKLTSDGAGEQEIDRATKLGRRFPQYGSSGTPRLALRKAYERHESRLGRKLTDEERLSVRQGLAAERFRHRRGRAPLDPVELEAEGSVRRDAVAGYDFVFTPVKSVSALWGIASDETRRVIYEAHRAAVDDAVRWLEENAAFTRSGNAGQAQIDVRGVIAAVFDHWDSRVGDPDLHTHVAVSNKVQGTDGKWRSLDGRALFAAAVSLSERYNSRVEDELRVRLGLQFVERPTTADRRSVREVDGVPLTLVERFSKRRQGIESQYADLLDRYRNEHGREPEASARHRLYQQATLTNRPDKAGARSLQEMVTSWRSEADVVLGLAGSGAVVEQQCVGRAAGSASAPVDRLADGVLSVLTESRSTWNVHHVRAEALRQCRPYAVPDRDWQVEAVVAAATAPTRSVRLAVARTVDEPPELRRASGEPVFTEHAADRYTSNAILDAEQRLVDAARGRGSDRLHPDALGGAACASQGKTMLNPGQRGLVRAFCGSGRLVQLGLAPAGTGKTTAMRAVADAWADSGRAVVALAPSAAAAGVLGTELGVRAETLAKFDVDQPELRTGTMILIDEAGTAGTLMLDRIVQRARAARAVVRLLGDDQQLGAVEAGGVLRLLAHDVGAVRMSEVVRFSDPDEASATLRVRDGDPAAIDFYLRADRILAGTTTTAPDAAYAGWFADQLAGRDSLLLAASSAQVSTLNERARADLVLAGWVSPDGAVLRDGNVAGVGDRVTTRRNDRLLGVHAGRDWVKNGDSWTVLAVRGDELTVVHREHRGQITLPADYVSAHVELDYARTIRRSQGTTVDRAHLLVDPSLGREDLYVGLTRARQGTRLYVATIGDTGPDHVPDAASGTEELLRAIVGRSRLEESATETLRLSMAASESLRRMAAEYEHALGVHVADRYWQTAEAAHPGITGDPAWPNVAQRLHRMEASGWPAADALRRADAMGSYVDAVSEAQVLSFRLDRLFPSTASTPGSPVPTWLASAPPTAGLPRWTEYLTARYQDMDRRISALASEQRSATWARSVPRSGLGSEAIRQVVAYRSVFNVDSADAVGPEPDRHTRQHEAWTAATSALQRARADSSTTTPGAARVTRELRERVDLPDDTRVAASAASSRHI